MHWNMRVEWSRQINRPRHEVVADLATALNDGDLDGELRDDGFTLKPGRRNRFMGRNSWRPSAEGKLVAAGGITLAQVTMQVQPWVRVFTMVHAVFFLGLTWVMGVLAFSFEADKLRRTLDEAMDGTRARG